MIFLTHLRTLTIALGVFVICCSVVTQTLARALGYAPELGDRFIEIGAVRVYAPWSFMQWTIAWSHVAPSLLALSILLGCICALASYAVAIVVAKLEPITLTRPSPWRDLASWSDLGDRGLLRDEGAALGAVRRHALASYDIVRSAGKRCVFLGDPALTDHALVAAISGWCGPLVLIEARGDITARLGRQNILQFAPARAAGFCFNPLLAIRGGLHAWDDARRLAGALLVLDREPWRSSATAEAFALLMLDQLFCAPVEARNLAALRRRLFAPTALLADLCGRWSIPPTAEDTSPVIWEMARAARALRAHPDPALSSYAKIDAALAPFADAGIAHASSTHQLSIGDFVAARGQRTLALSMAGVVDENAAPLVAALLAQLAAACSSNGATQEFLIAVDAKAARQLAESTKHSLLLGSDWHVVIQAADIDLAQRLVGCGGSAYFDALVAIGPQTADTAAHLSVCGGRCLTHRPLPHQIPRWRGQLFPAWVPNEVERLPTEALKAARADEALLVARHQKPALLTPLIGGGLSTFLAPAKLPAAPHAWNAPPHEQRRAELNASASTPSTASQTPAGAKLRRVLTRKSAPYSAHKGANGP